MTKKILVSVFLVMLVLGGPRAQGNPIGDFFKRLGQTIGRYRRPAPPQKEFSKSTKKKEENEAGAVSKEKPSPPPPAPVPTATPIDIRPAIVAPAGKEMRDLPYAISIPGKPGLVTSPYAPNEGYVDVRAFPSSTEVLDPFTGKIFLTP